MKKLNDIDEEFCDDESANKIYHNSNIPQLGESS